MSGQYGQGQPQRPYGANEGDIWLGEGSEVQAMLDEQGEGLKLVHQVLRQEDGSLEEAIFVTDDEEILAEAREGTEKWIAARAQSN